MTIIAGFQCADGILMCSDTEESLFGEAKSQVRKVPFFRLKDMNVAIGGAGDGALIDYVTQDLVKRLSASPFDWTTAESWFDQYAKKVFRDNIRCYAGLPRDFAPDVSFLIAVVMGGECRLFKWERNFVYALPPMKHDSIGIGTLQSRQLLRETEFYFPARWMLFFAVRMMQRVKQLVQGCGGKTEVIFLDQSGDIIIQWGVFQIDQIEQLVSTVDEFITGNVLTFIANPNDLDKKQVERQAEMHKSAIGNLREKYRNLVPELFERVPEK